MCSASGSSCVVTVDDVPSPQLTVKLYVPELTKGSRTEWSSEEAAAPAGASPPFCEVRVVSQVLTKSVVTAFAGNEAVKLPLKTNAKVRPANTNFFMKLCKARAFTPLLEYLVYLVFDRCFCPNRNQGGEGDEPVLTC